jgi:ABC-2 type transport system permease protein
MRRYSRLIGAFIGASVQQEAAYRANFLIKVTHSLLNFGTGLLGLAVLFGQVKTVRGWDHASTLAVLGVYLIISALRDLFISPSLDALAGMDGEVWRGDFDFTLLRPVGTQFLASFRHWRPLALFDLLLGAGVLVAAVVQLEHTLAIHQLLAFLVTLSVGALVVYAILLTFTALAFWSPGFLFTWVFGGIFQMARYPVGLYPGGLRLVLTWVVPVGVITTVPAQALTGDLTLPMFAGALVFAAVLVIGASILFRAGLRRYASASS